MIPRGGAGGTAIYGLYRYICAAVKGIVFKQFTLGSEEFTSRKGYHFKETDQFVKDFSLD